MLSSLTKENSAGVQGLVNQLDKWGAEEVERRRKKRYVHKWIRENFLPAEILAVGDRGQESHHLTNILLGISKLGHTLAVVPTWAIIENGKYPPSGMPTQFAASRPERDLRCGFKPILFYMPVQRKISSSGFLTGLINFDVNIATIEGYSREGVPLFDNISTPIEMKQGEKCNLKMPEKMGTLPVIFQSICPDEIGAIPGDSETIISLTLVDGVYEDSREQEIFEALQETWRTNVPIMPLFA